MIGTRQTMMSVAGRSEPQHRSRPFVSSRGLRALRHGSKLCRSALSPAQSSIFFNRERVVRPEKNARVQTADVIRRLRRCALMLQRQLDLGSSLVGAQRLRGDRNFPCHGRDNLHAPRRWVKSLEWPNYQQWASLQGWLNCQQWAMSLEWPNRSE